LARYLVRFENRIGAVPRDRNPLSRLAYDSVKHLGEDIGNLRIGSSAVELDLLLASAEHLEPAIRILEARIGQILTVRELDVVGPKMEKEAAVLLGIDLFNQERYWESHEALESAWLIAEGQEKEVLQGLILTAAAFVHLQKGENDVTISIMDRAYQKLRNHTRCYFGIDIDKVARFVESILLSGKPTVFRIESS